VVVQSDAFLPRSVVLVAPTSTSAKPASFRPEIKIDGIATRGLVEQVGAVDVQRLGALAGRLAPKRSGVSMLPGSPSSVSPEHADRHARS
jgi:mRNA interferase MazF